MENELVRFILLCVVASIFMSGVFALFIRSAKKDFKERDNHREETLSYLNSVLKRTELSTSPEALRILGDELNLKIQTLKFDSMTYPKYKVVVAFLVGKYQGLKKITDRESKWLIK